MPRVYKKKNKKVESNYEKEEKINKIELNSFVNYINSDGNKYKVKIIGIHFDTPPDLYYTIEFEDGRVKQTISDRLEKLNI